MSNNRKEQVREYLEEYGKKMRLMANGLAKMLDGNSRALFDEELAEYIKYLYNESSMYLIYSEELDKLEEEGNAQ